MTMKLYFDLLNGSRLCYLSNILRKVVLIVDDDHMLPVDPALASRSCSAVRTRFQALIQRSQKNRISHVAYTVTLIWTATN